NKHVLIYGQVVPAANVLLDVAGELPWEVLRHVVEGFAPVPANQGRAHFTRDHREDGSHTLVLRSGPEDRFAEPRDSGDGDLPRIDGLLRFEIVDRPTDAPGPGADRPPLVRGRLLLARLQRQSDDSLLPLAGPIGLNVRVTQRRVSPALAESLTD